MAQLAQLHDLTRLQAVFHVVDEGGQYGQNIRAGHGAAALNLVDDHLQRRPSGRHRAGVVLVYASALSVGDVHFRYLVQHDSFFSPFL